MVVPAYDEERHIGRTLDGVPAYADLVYVVDDASRDGTRQRVEASMDPRVSVVRHRVNRGVGAAIVSGYEQAIADGCDLVAVMAGDAQMNPDDLERLLEALDDSGAAYAKGNRFIHPAARRMPLLRRWGSRVLSALTRAATGLSVDDTQCGYTVIRSSCAAQLPLDDLWPRYGYPNHLLALLANRAMAIVEVPVTPVYADERSGLRPWHLFVICGLIAYLWLTLGRRRKAAPDATVATQPPRRL